MEPYLTVAIDVHPETVLVVLVKWAEGTIPEPADALELNTKQRFGKIDHRVDVRCRFYVLVGFHPKSCLA